KKSHYPRTQQSLQPSCSNQSPSYSPHQNDAVSAIIDLTASPPSGVMRPIVASYKFVLPDTNPHGKPKSPTVVPLKLTSDESITPMFLDGLPVIAIPVLFRLLQYLQKRAEESLFSYCKSKFPKE